MKKLKSILNNFKFFIKGYIMLVKEQSETIQTMLAYLFLIDEKHKFLKSKILKFYQMLLEYYFKFYRKKDLTEDEYLKEMYNTYTDIINFSLKNREEQDLKIINYLLQLNFNLLIEESFFRYESNLALFNKIKAKIILLLKKIFNELIINSIENDGWLDFDEFKEYLAKYKKTFKEIKNEIEDLEINYLAKKPLKFKKRNINEIKKIIKEKIWLT